MKVYGDVKLLTPREVLWRGDERRQRDDVVDEHGEQATEFAEILEALGTWADRPRPLSVPRRVFLSYRRGDDSTNAWATRLVRDLEDLGNIVVFDGGPAGSEVSRDIPALVGSLAHCHYFVYVVDPRYMERIESQGMIGRHHGWASSEFRVARSVGEILRMPLIGLLREGDRIPRGTRLATESAGGSVFDVRTRSLLDRVLGGVFGRTTRVPDSAALEAAALVHESEIATELGDDPVAFSLARRAAALVPDAVETQAQRAVAALCVNALGDALEAAEKMLQLDDLRFSSRYLAGLVLALNWQAERAINLLTPMLSVEADNWRVKVALAAAWKGFGFGGNAGDIWEEVAAAHPSFAEAVAAWAETPESVPWKDIRNTPSPGLPFPRVAATFLTREVRGVHLREVQGDFLINTHIEIGPDLPGARGRRGADQILLSRAAPYLCLLAP